MFGERAWRIWSCDAHLLVTDPSRVDGASAIADAWLTAVGDACDRFRPDSELRRLPSGRPVSISPTLAHLVDTALQAAAETDGLCDPTLGRVLDAAGYDRDIRLILDEDRPVRVVMRPPLTWQAVQLDGDRLTVPEGLELDLGATAKAAAADLIARDIAAELGCGVLMNLGGDLATAGPAPDGGWQVTVRDAPGEPETQVAVQAGYALATSSTLKRTWRRGDEQVHHIIDPRLGRPAAAVWRTVSVVAPTAARANAATTAAVVAGESAVDGLLASGLPARLVAADRGVVLLNGWPAETMAVA